MAGAQKLLAWNLNVACSHISVRGKAVEKNLAISPCFSRLASCEAHQAPLVLVHLSTEPILSCKVGSKVSSKLKERTRKLHLQVYIGFQTLN